MEKLGAAAKTSITDMDKLSEEQGFKHVFAALQAIEKVTVVKKTEQFDRFFEKGFRKRGQPLDAYIRTRRQDWADLQDLDAGTTMSPDLLAYFILKQSGLSKDDRRQILLSTGSAYDLDSIERSMKVSYYDIHEKEKSRFPEHPRKGYGKSKKHYANLVEDENAFEDDGSSKYEADSVYDQASAYDQASEYDQSHEYEAEHGYEAVVSDSPASDMGASGDDEVFQAFTTMDKQRRSYKESRRRLREVQKQRGFFKGELTFEQRKAAVAREKERTRCSACGRIGHWAGDSECKAAKSAGSHKGKGKGKSAKKATSSKAYLASAEPMFFTLDDSQFQDGVPPMACMNHADEANSMDQDAGYTENDDRRKMRAPTYSQAEDSDAPCVSHRWSSAFQPSDAR